MHNIFMDPDMVFFSSKIKAKYLILISIMTMKHGGVI